MRRSDQTHDRGDIVVLLDDLRDALSRLLILSDEGRLFHEIAGRIPTNAQFGKDDETGAGLRGAAAEVDDARGVPAEVPNGRVDLPERDLHCLSLMDGAARLKNQAAQGCCGFCNSGSGSPGRRSVGLLAGCSAGATFALAVVSFMSISRSVRTIFSPPTFMILSCTTSSPTKRTNSTSCGGAPKTHSSYSLSPSFSRIFWSGRPFERLTKSRSIPMRTRFSLSACRTLGGSDAM